VEILINHKSSEPIYEQIDTQIKQMILSGTLQDGDIITSVRMLAKELGVGVLTVQKAYDKLQNEGIIETVIGKGTYISIKNMSLLEDEKYQALEVKAKELVKSAKQYNVELEDIFSLIKLLYDDECCGGES
jgi:GntR family transcriptional regulator